MKRGILCSIKKNCGSSKLSLQSLLEMLETCGRLWFVLRLSQTRHCSKSQFHPEVIIEVTVHGSIVSMQTLVNISAAQYIDVIHLVIITLSSEFLFFDCLLLFLF